VFSSLRPTDPSTILSPSIELLRIFALVTEFGLILRVVTARALILAVVTAFALSCLGPTLLRGTRAA
jgi:hypothetical protein